jgi:hypothetical protein
LLPRPAGRTSKLLREQPALENKVLLLFGVIIAFLDPTQTRCTVVKAHSFRLPPFSFSFPSLILSKGKDMKNEPMF